jgi:hypothetical protein
MRLAGWAVALAVGVSGVTVVGCGPVRSPCTASTCSDGCCSELTGACIAATSSSECGTRGETCKACRPTEVCTLGGCTASMPVAVAGGTAGGTSGGVAGGTAGGAAGGGMSGGIPGGCPATPCGSQEVCQTGACRWNDASLASLTVAPASLSFTPSQTMYAVSVPTGTPSVVVTAAVAQPARATVRINGTVTASGAPDTVTLTGGSATVTVRVDAESGISRTYSVVVLASGTTNQQAYVKASNTGAGDYFGFRLSLSGDGSTLAVGAFAEDSNATGVNGSQADTSAFNSGAVYVFTRTGNTWAQQAYLKASNTDARLTFGESVALSADGSTLAVGASSETSNATGVNGNQADTSAANSGAVYVFTRTGSTWAQQAYLKASNTGTSDLFGEGVALSADGDTLAVGAVGEASNAIGVNGNQADNSAANSGAVYVFTRTGSTWAQQAYLKASNTGTGGRFGFSVALSGDGDTLAVGAVGEASNATGVNGNQADNTATLAGAVYVFTRTGSTWAQQAYLKASNTGAGGRFGFSVALSGDGDTLAVGPATPPE